MNAQTLLRDLAARGVILSADGAQLDVDAPDELMTDELLTTLKAHKAELIALLRSEPDAGAIPAPEVEEFALTPPDAPAPTVGAQLGTAARPRILRGTRMPWDCPWHTCNGWLVGSNPARCSTCETWFELKPPDGVYD
jgi:TubC N-terminal docking domain